ncbi:hypothetical protein ACLB2K_007305 [Fragaria x ananassa]
MGKKSKLVSDTRSLVDLVFSWSLGDVLNENLYRNQVQRIPDTFDTVASYKKTFIPSLVDETHADLLLNVLILPHAPTCEILTIMDSDEPPDDLFYDVTYKRDMEANENDKELMYEPQAGDIIALTNVRPKCIDDLNRPPRFYLIAYVAKANDIDEYPDLLQFKILSSKPINYGELGMNKSKRETLFAVRLINLMTNVRVWKALNSEEGNTNIINKVLQAKSDDGDSCSVCFSKEKCCTRISDIWPTIRSQNLNDSQEAAVLNCINLSQCHHQNSVKLIWGPPGTGKTKTMSLTLYALFQLKCRTLTCAPTNIAVLEIAARLRRSVNQSLEYGGYGLGDIVLFGNNKRMKIDNNDDVRDIFLDHRVKILIKCLVPLSGWKHLLSSMIHLLDDPVEHYSMYLQKRAAKQKQNAEKNEEGDRKEDYLLTFEEFVKNEFDSVRLKLVLNDFKVPGSTVGCLRQLRTKCTNTLKSLPKEFSVPISEYALKNFCLENACLIFCTASTSSKLHVVAETRPLELLVIDEAAQLKECESAIPLQISGLRHAILVGDERQVPAMVKSKIAASADFGRSLFERLAKLGHKKHLLNVQYRMHPSISLFPKKEFYDNQIVDGPNVKETSYKRCFLKGKMYRSYSFINVANGKDEFDHRCSLKNMVEVAVVCEIVASLYKVGNASTLVTSDSVWKKLVLDAKKRNCFHNADEDSNLAQAITTALIELDQLHSLLNIGSMLFKNTIWKVCFTGDFLNSITKIKDTAILGEVLALLTSLSRGWRSPHKDKGNVVYDGTSAQLLEKYKIKGHMNLIWTVDIIQENAHYVQVIKFWDILPFSHLPELAKRLHIVFGKLTVDKMNRCKHKCVDRATVVPMRWPVVFSNFPIDDHEEFLSKPLSSLIITANPKTSTTTYGEIAERYSNKSSSESIVNRRIKSSWKLKVGGCSSQNTKLSEHHETPSSGSSQCQADGVKDKESDDMNWFYLRTDDADHHSDVSAGRRVNWQKELNGAGMEDADFSVESTGDKKKSMKNQKRVWIKGTRI